MSVSLLVVESDEKGGHAELCPQQVPVCLASSTGHRMKTVKPPYLGKELRAGWAHVRTDAQGHCPAHRCHVCSPENSTIREPELIPCVYTNTTKTPQKIGSLWLLVPSVHLINTDETE